MLYSRYIRKEEALALFSSLIVTGILVFLVRQLKYEPVPKNHGSILVEYEDFPLIPLPQPRSATTPAQLRKTVQPVSARVVGPTSVDSSGREKEKALPSGAPAATDTRFKDSSKAQSVFLFRSTKSDMLVDSIFKSDSIIRPGLLRQHFSYSMSVYDTALAFHLGRLANDMRQFDARPVTLQEEMQRQMRRTGHPFDPTRPQPPSPQIPLGGVLSSFLNLIF